MSESTIKAMTPEGVTEEASEKAQDVLRDVQSRWNKAARTWDVEGLTAMYTCDALMYGGRTGMSLGHSGMRAYFSSYLDLLASTTMQLRGQIMIELAPDVFLAQGYSDFGFVLTSGKKSGTTMRTTLIIVKREGEWLIIQHHFSSTPETPPIPQ